MHKIVFFISNFISYFIYGTENRRVWRGRVNICLFYPSIRRFIKQAYGEKVKSIKFIRQRTLNRMVCMVNNKYYIKVFRNVSVQQLKDFEFLNNYVEQRLKVKIPHIVADNKIPMYACEHLDGKLITEFDKSYVLENDQKVLKQIHGIIGQLQRIKVDEIPNKERFFNSMQLRTKEEPCRHPKQVLAHFDLNELNFLFDDNLNICAVIDWDTLSIANNPSTDTTIFLKYWNAYKRRGR